MFTVVLIIHVLACIALIMIVLLQKGKGADLGAAFGGASQTVFGSRGAGGFLARLTTAAAVIFMLTCLSLAYMTSHRAHETVMRDAATGQEPAAKAEAVGGADSSEQKEQKVPSAEEKTGSVSNTGQEVEGTGKPAAADSSKASQ